MGTYCCSATQDPEAGKNLAPKTIRKIADVSKFAAKLKYLQSEDKTFIDTEFSPAPDSIIKKRVLLEGESEDAGSKYDEIRETNWKRAEEISSLVNKDGALTLFLDDIEPDDI